MQRFSRFSQWYILVIKYFWSRTNVKKIPWAIFFFAAVNYWGKSKDAMFTQVVIMTCLPKLRWLYLWLVRKKTFETNQNEIHHQVIYTCLSSFCFRTSIKLRGDKESKVLGSCFKPFSYDPRPQSITIGMSNTLTKESFDRSIHTHDQIPCVENMLVFLFHDSQLII